VTRRLNQKYGHRPSNEEIAHELGVSTEKVDQVRMATSAQPISLETPLGDEEASRLGDFIEDEATLSPEEHAAHSMLKEELDSALAALTPRERGVLELRYGLYDGRSRTLYEVGSQFGVTRERIRQIEKKAINKLRHPSRSHRLRGYLEHS
jgi:RNA polymerase primary sigma factor